ncbi:hypothetical protein ACN28I_31645 [Archangium gephyra]|uniref:hypothetical protein n=1 Tax=Archangium gephyra TaxID=48 RepID=UPI003B7DA371
MTPLESSVSSSEPSAATAVPTSRPKYEVLEAERTALRVEADAHELIAGGRVAVPRATQREE